MSDTRYLFIAALLSAVSLPWNANALTVSDKPISNFIDTHTYTSTPSTKPAVSFAQPDKAYKIAGVCFLGMGGCGDDGHFNKGSSGGGGSGGDGDFEIDTDQQCQKEGYSITSCPAGSSATGICPYDDKYYSGYKTYEELCKQDNYYKTCSGGMVLDPDQSCDYDSSYKKCIPSEEACVSEGYQSSCEDGKILDPGQVCSYNSSYQKCECNPCDGFEYSYEEATAQGYEVDGEACNSCGVMKYKRKVKECLGFSVCDCGGEIGTTECWSGEQQMFLNCKACVEECDSGEIDLNNYWCNGDLKCIFGGR